VFDIRAPPSFAFVRSICRKGKLGSPVALSLEHVTPFFPLISLFVAVVVIFSFFSFSQVSMVSLIGSLVHGSVMAEEGRCGMLHVHRQHDGPTALEVRLYACTDANGPLAVEEGLFVPGDSQHIDDEEHGRGLVGRWYEQERGTQSDMSNHTTRGCEGINLSPLSL
jgi:hypothetical protein